MSTEELKHNTTSRRAYRSHLKKLVSKVRETVEIFNSDATSLTDLRDQLQRKQTILTELDTKIAASLTDEEELEKEITDSEEYCSLIATHIARITHLIEVSKVTQPVHSLRPSTESREHTETHSTPGVSPERIAATVTHKPQDNHSSSQVKHSTVLWEYSRLAIILGLF